MERVLGTRERHHPETASDLINDPELDAIIAEREARGAMTGDDATRIYHEVLGNVTESADDTDEQRAFRTRIVESVSRIKREGGVAEPIIEWP